MSERPEVASENSEKTISHRLAILNAEKRPLYWLQREELKERGEEVWVIEELGRADEYEATEDRGIYLAFYIGKDKKGLIEGTVNGLIDGYSREGFELYDFIPDENDHDSRVIINETRIE
jgi:hypothetical protein